MKVAIDIFIKIISNYFKYHIRKHLLQYLYLKVLWHVVPIKLIFIRISIY